MAQRALDRRLTDELIRFKTAIAQLSKELNEVREHDQVNQRPSIAHYSNPPHKSPSIAHLSNPPHKSLSLAHLLNPPHLKSPSKSPISNPPDRRRHIPLDPALTFEVGNPPLVPSPALLPSPISLLQ